jgi:4-amino-4-deoxy-L-arabinose transferase-like glycosyltransferase
LRRPSWGLALLLALFAVRLVASAADHSLTADEPHYIGTGVHLWKSGDYHFARTLKFQPPLAYHLASLPLLGLDLSKVSATDDVAKRLVTQGVVKRGTLRLLSRLPFALLACWGALLVYLWACEAAGPAAGLLAAAIYTLSPMLLAHGSIAHSDIVVSVLYTQVLYTFWRWYRQPGTARLLVCGISLGLALLAKYSALLLLPTLGLLLIGAAWQRVPARPGPARPAPDGTGRRALWLAGVAATLAVTAVATLWLGYGGSFAAVAEPGSRFPELALPGWLQPFSFYLDVHAAGRRVYFLGQFAREWPGFLFFPIAYAIKTPLGILVLLVLSLASLRRTPSPLGRFLAVPMLFFLAVVFFWVNIPTGLRYLLPLYPLIAVFVGTQLASADPGPGAARALAVAALAWTALAGLWIHPHYLAYFNESIGGPRQGHRYLLDANLDWGQDLPALARDLRRRGDRVAHIAWFGPESPADYGIRMRPLTGCRPVHGLVAISANVREGLYAFPNVFAEPVPGCYDWLREFEPVSRPGWSFFVYDIPAKALP